jgi:hypothetical protein
LDSGPILSLTVISTAAKKLSSNVTAETHTPFLKDFDKIEQVTKNRNTSDTPRLKGVQVPNSLIQNPDK